MRSAVKVLLFCGLTYVIVTFGVFLGMLQPPAVFTRAAAQAPAALIFTLMPAETLWRIARAGRLRVGDPAPDFSLPTLHQTDQVRLSSHRGLRPVLLVFGSYT